MFDLHFLEKIFASPYAVPIVLSLAILWLVNDNRRLRKERDALYERQIRFLETRNAELSAENRAMREMGSG